jgi:hypothetical protein
MVYFNCDVHGLYKTKLPTHIAAHLQGTQVLRPKANLAKELQCPRTNQQHIHTQQTNNI